MSIGLNGNFKEFLKIPQNCHKKAPETGQKDDIREAVT
jgi:hypothetical protein